AVLGRIHALLKDRSLLEYVPAEARTHLESAQLIACSQERLIRWEVHCIQRVLLDIGAEFALLKGAAYIMSELPFARGRLQSDVDILVPRGKLAAVESALLDHGW